MFTHNGNYKKLMTEIGHVIQFLALPFNVVSFRVSFTYKLPIVLESVEFWHDGNMCICSHVCMPVKWVALAAATICMHNLIKILSRFRNFDRQIHMYVYTMVLVTRLQLYVCVCTIYISLIKMCTRQNFNSNLSHLCAAAEWIQRFPSSKIKTKIKKWKRMKVLYNHITTAG